MALPLALIVMVVLLLMGTALWQYSMADTIQVARDENRMKAYYLARSGAATTGAYIIKNPSEADNLIYQQSQSQPTSLGDGTFRVNVYGTTDHVVIEGIGEVAGIEQKAVLNLKKVSVLEQYVLAGNGINLGGAVSVVGDMLLPAAMAGLHHWSGNVSHDGDIVYEDLDFPEVVFPDLPAGSPYHISLGANNRTGTLVPGHRYGNVYLGPHSLLTMKLGNNPNTIYPVRMDILDLANHNARLTLEGDGIAYLYLREFKGRGSGFFIEGNASVVLFLEPGGAFDLHGTPSFMGMVYGPSATVNLGGGSTFKGSIVANEITSTGNVSIEYISLHAPGDIFFSYTQDTWRDK